MPFPWSKSSSKVTKKKNNSSKDKLEAVLPKLHHLGRKGQRLSEDEAYGSSRGSRTSLDSPSESRATSEVTSLSPSAVRPRTPNFAEPVKGQPLPLPPEDSNGHFSLPTYNQVDLKQEPVELDGATSGYGSVSMSSTSSVSSGEVADTWLANAGRPPYYDQNGQGNLFSPQKGGAPKHTGRNLRPEPLLKNPLPGNKANLSSPRKAPATAKEGTPNGTANVYGNVPARSAPTSLWSSPCHSPRRLSTSEQYAMFGVQRMLPENTLSQGSNYNSAHNSTNTEAPGFLQHGRASPEKSPLASPRRSPGPSSRIQSGAVSPVHWRVNGLGTDSPGGGHRLPLPPSNTSAFPNSPMNTPPTASAFPNSPVNSSPSGIPSHILSRDGPSSPVTRWQKGNLLGYGSFGRVYKGFSDSGTFCAMKEVLIVDDPKSKECVKQLMQEINMLSSLRHPNIVQYLGSEMLEDRLYIYLEFVSGGSIQKVLQEYGAFKEPVIRSYTNQILSGLAYLHSMNKVHRDIKGANILVDTNGEVKLADFGMAKHISSNSLVLSFKGSPYWMAPEVFKNTNAQSYPVDIWSLGCTIIEMATGKPPWSQYEGVAAMFKIGNSKEVPHIPENLSLEAQDFIRLCLQRNPDDRPTAARLLEHRFVKSAYEELPDAASPTLLSLHFQQIGDSKPDFTPDNTRAHYFTREQPLHAQSKTLSPVGSPSVHSRSIYSSYGGLTPVISSGSSTPRAAGYDDIGGSPRALHGFTKERFTMASRSPRMNGMQIDVRNDARFSLGNRPQGSPLWNGQLAHTPDASPRRTTTTNDILGMAFSQNSREADSSCRYYGNGPLADRTLSPVLTRHSSPLRNMERLY